MNRWISTIFFAFLFACICVLRADRMMPAPYVAAWGSWYAKSFPAQEAARQGGNQDAGETLVYAMGKEPGDADQLLHRFNWYAPKVYLTWCDGVCVVRMGQWAYREQPTEKDLAIAFYRDGVLLARHSPLDLIGRSDSWRALRQSGKVQLSSVGYSIREQVVGFVFIYKKEGDNVHFASPDRGFEIVLHDGRHIVFDLGTGKPLVLAENEFTRPDPRGR